jgi:hypothetical protein
VSFARRGYGIRLAPRCRFLAARPGGLTVAANFYRDDAQPSVLIIGPGRPVDLAAAGVEDVAELSRGPEHRRWVIATDGYSIPWLEELTVSSVGPEVRWAFELHRSRGAMISAAGRCAVPSRRRRRRT